MSKRLWQERGVIRHPTLPQYSNHEQQTDQRGCTHYGTLHEQVVARKDMYMCSPSPTHEVKRAQKQNERVHTRTTYTCSYAIVHPQKHTLAEHEHIKHEHREHTCIHSYTCTDTHMLICTPVPTHECTAPSHISHTHTYLQELVQ